VTPPRPIIRLATVGGRCTGEGRKQTTTHVVVKNERRFQLLSNRNGESSESRRIIMRKSN